MPIKIIHPDHFELLGEGYVLLTSPHRTDSEADLHTGQIVESAALTSRGYAIVGKVSGDYADVNRAEFAQEELRKSIQAMLADNGIRCIIEIYGKKDEGVDIGTAKGETASTPVIELVATRLSKDFNIRVNPESDLPSGQSIITPFAKRDPNGQFLLEALQLGLGHQERNHERDKLVTDIAELVATINRHLGFKEDIR